MKSIFFQFLSFQLLFPLLLFSQEMQEPSMFAEQSIPQSSFGGLSTYSETGIGNANVDIYTGRASYAVPLFQLKSFDIAVPLQLQYISSGVKISQIPDWVGIDWSFQPGGIISRQVQGLPDDMPVSGYFYQASLINSFTENSSPTNNDTDLQPDIYFYSFGPYSGIFKFSTENTGFQIASKIRTQILNFILAQYIKTRHLIMKFIDGN